MPRSQLLQCTCFFSKLDLWNVYHLIRICSGKELKTAFKTPLGHFEKRMMQFGLTSALTVFQALVTDVLRDMLNKFLFVYIDDVLIFSETEKEQVQHVWLVLRHLLENSLFVKAEKCELHLPIVSFLGLITKRVSFFLTQLKWRKWLSGQPQPHEGSSSSFSDLPVFIVDSFGTSVGWLPR